MPKVRVYVDTSVRSLSRTLRHVREKFSDVVHLSRPRSVR